MRLRKELLASSLLSFSLSSPHSLPFLFPLTFLPFSSLPLPPSSNSFPPLPLLHLHSHSVPPSRPPSTFFLLLFILSLLLSLGVGEQESGAHCLGNLDHMSDPLGTRAACPSHFSKLETTVMFSTHKQGLSKPWELFSL